MFDATKLLGGFLQGRTGKGANSVMAGGIGTLIQQAVTHFGQATQNPSPQNPATQSQGVASQGAAPQGTGFMADVAALARRAMADPASELRANNPAAIAGAGAIAGALMGGTRGAVGGGLLAVLGSLAYKSYADSAAPTPPAPPQLTDPADIQRKATLVLRAMVQATKADGQLDDAERARLAEHVGGAGNEPEARAFLEAEMNRPVDLDGLAREARSPIEAAEIYAASLLAITVDTDAERDYLARLATALNLPQDVAAGLRNKAAA